MFCGYILSKDVEFSDGEIKRCFFEMDRTTFPNCENGLGREITFSEQKSEKNKIIKIQASNRNSVLRHSRKSKFTDDVLRRN